MDTDRSPKTSFVNTVTESTLLGVNTNKEYDSYSTSLLTRAISPVHKVDSWFASSSAGPCQSSTRRLITSNTASTPVTGFQNQLSNQVARDPVLDLTSTGPSIQEMSWKQLLDEENEQHTTELDASTVRCSSPAIAEGKLLNSHVDSEDPFFDTVPKCATQLSNSNCNAGAPTFDPEKSTRGLALTSSSSWDKKETSTALGEYPHGQHRIIGSDIQQVQGTRINTRPHLSLTIPTISTESENFGSAPVTAAHLKISECKETAPHTADSLVPTAGPSTPNFQDPRRQENRVGDILNPTEKFSDPRTLLHRDKHTLFQPIAPSHTNSRTWISNLVVEKEKWQRVEDSLGRMNLLRSFVVPKTLKDWLAHQQDRTDAKRAREQRRLEEMNLPQRDFRLPLPGRPVRIGPAFGGKAFRYRNFGAVLPFPSIWACRYQAPAKRLDPLWPCIEEMKEEGDERNTSGFRRFPALPRKPGNNTVQYKLKAFQPFLPFDTVWKLPTEKSVKAAMEVYPLEEIKKMEGFLGWSLLDALDCTTEDSF